MNEKSCGMKIVSILDVMKWTQNDLAEVMGVGQKTMSFWARDIKKPSLKNREKIDLVYQFIRDYKHNDFADPKQELLRRLAAKEESRQEEEQLVNVIKITPAQYYKNKEFVLNQEKTNDSKIYLFPSKKATKDAWYKIGGRSYLFYKYFLIDRLGRSVTLQADLDPQFIFRFGLGSVKRGDQLMTQLEEIGYHVTMMDGGVMVVDMKKKYTKQEIKELGERERAERLAVENIVKPKNNYPLIAVAIRELADYIINKIKQMDAAHRDVLGRALVEPAIELTKIYHRMANGRMVKADAKDEMLKRTDDIAGAITFMDAAQVLELRARVRLGQCLRNLRSQIEEGL